jgi:aminopeptidase N
MENYGCVTCASVRESCCLPACLPACLCVKNPRARDRRYRETAILWDSAKSASSAKQRVAYVVAHELAHQWFGNLTTMQWWDNLWLNEGFATFVGTMAVDKLFPEWDIWTQFVKDDWANALDLDSMRSSHPIQVEVYSADEVSEIFDAISYYKGASVIRSVFEWIGESAFQEGLQKYLAKFQFANTVTDDLWGAWEDSSGKPVRTVMSTWTLQTGYPLLTVSEQCDNAGLLSVEQTRFLKDGSAGEGLWKIPVATRQRAVSVICVASFD